MKIAFTAALALALLAPTSAWATPNQCASLNRQIEHYGEMLQRAHDMGSDMWEQRMSTHVENLLVQRAALCPEYAEDDSTMRMLAGLLKLAAQAALTYFTMGAL